MLYIALIALALLIILRYYEQPRSFEEIQDDVYKRAADKVEKANQDFSRQAAEAYYKKNGEVFRTGRPPV